jgi:hypothetical protein
VRLYLITTYKGSFDCINRHFSRVTENVSLGFLKGYVEAYEPRTGFVHPHDGYDALGPLGDITSIAAQHVTRSQGGNITIRVKYH